MASKFLPGFIILLILLAVLGTQSFFIVDQRQQAIKLFLGAPEGNAEDQDSFIKKPGIHFKIPFLHTVRYFDRRILAVDPPPAQVVISSARIESEQEDETDEMNAQQEAEPNAALRDVSGEPIIVDTFARYKIIDPLQFLKTLRTTEQADGRLENILNSATRSVLGKTSLKQLLSPDRMRVMQAIQAQVNRTTQNEKLGIEIVDVRIVRADLTPELRTSTVRRMISELKERATETRAKGEERALEIRSTANKEREILLAEAKRDSEIIRGEGDRIAIETYANSFNQDKDFYSFYRSQEAYKKALSDKETTFVLNPQNSFLEHLTDIK
jgi:modulator of FtsH protease HflC